MNFKHCLIIILYFLFIILCLGICFLSPIFKRFPKPTGPYNVGTRSHEIHDEAQEFTIRYWYPTEQEYITVQYGNSKQNKWMKTHIAKALNIPYMLFKNAFNATTHSASYAPLSNVKETYPVIIFLPGYGASYDYYTALLESLASHGYMIVSINTSTIQPMFFDDGRMIQPNDGINVDKMTPLILNTKYTIELIQRINDEEDSIWRNRINLKKLCIMGHSLGGSAAIIIAQIDEGDSIAAGINLDGWLEMEAIQAIPIPFL